MKANVNDDEIQKIKSQRSRRALIRNRWCLYAMLSLNPSIIKYRVRFLSIKNKKEKKTSTFKSRFSFGIQNNRFEEEMVVKAPIPEDDMPIAYIDLYDIRKNPEVVDENRTEEDNNNSISPTEPLTTSMSPPITATKSSEESIEPNELLFKNIFHGNNEHSSLRTNTDTDLLEETEPDHKIKNNESKIDLSGADDVDVDFRDNKINILDTDESTPILTRRAKIRNTEL